MADERIYLGSKDQITEILDTDAFVIVTSDGIRRMTKAQVMEKLGINQLTKKLEEDISQLSEEITDVIEGNETIEFSGWFEGGVNKNGEVYSDDNKIRSLGYYKFKTDGILTIQCMGEFKSSYYVFERNSDDTYTIVEYGDDTKSYREIGINADLYYRFVLYDATESNTINPENIDKYAVFTKTLSTAHIRKDGEEVKQIKNDIELLQGNNKTKSINVELTDNAITTAGTKGGTSTITKSFELEVNAGERYRITVGNGFAVGVHLGNVNLNWVALPMVELCFKETKTYIIGIRRYGELEFDDTSKALLQSNLKVEKVLYFNNTGKYDKIVASSDATKEEKAMADIICDGVNDEIEISCALNANISSGHNCNVLLVGKNFYIDDFYKCNYAGGSERNTIVDGRGFNAIMVERSFDYYNKHYTVSLSGKYNERAHYSSDIKLIISDELYSSISPTKDEEYSIIGAVRKNDENEMGQFTLLLGLYVDHIFISPNGIEKAICCIDGCGFSVLGIDSVTINKKDDTNSKLYMNEYDIPDGLIGIRGVHGSNNGVNNYIKRTRIIGMYEGLALTGEHFIIEDTLFHSCIIGYTIGNYPVAKQMEHPNVFIGCSVEQCKRIAIFNRYGSMEESTVDTPQQTIVYIGGSMESVYYDSDGTTHYVQPIKEIVKGAYRGKYETDYSAPNRIFEEGSGKFISAKNYNIKTNGLESEKPWNMVVDEGGEYFCTDSLKTYRIVNGSWIEI